MPLWVGMARASRERALSILLWDKTGHRRPRAYWDRPEHVETYAYLMGVLWESTRAMQGFRQEWQTQEVNGVTVRFRPDGSFEVEGERYEQPKGTPSGEPLRSGGREERTPGQIV